MTPLQEQQRTGVQDEPGSALMGEIPAGSLAAEVDRGPELGAGLLGQAEHSPAPVEARLASRPGSIGAARSHHETGIR